LFAVICGFGEPEDLRIRIIGKTREGFIRRYSEKTGPLYALAAVNEML
jgi:hypothetical protein